jgi:hypothetical protein
MGAQADGAGAAATQVSVDRLNERLDRVEALLARLEGAPGMVAMFVDILDEWARDVTAQGIEIDRSLAQGLHAALWLGQRVSETELERLGILLRSDVLEPHALAVVGKTGKALAECHETACGRGEPELLGPLGLLKALRDPDVQRSLGFLVNVARRFGKQLPVAG